MPSILRGRQGSDPIQPGPPSEFWPINSPRFWFARRLRCSSSSTTDRPIGRRTPARLARPYIDLAVPRGGESLIRRVVAEAKMPVMKHYQGQLPRLCRRRVPTRRSAVADHRQFQSPTAGGLQRRGDPAGESLGAPSSFLAQSGRPALLQARGVELRGDPSRRWKIVPEMTGPALPVRLGPTEYLGQDPGDSPWLARSMTPSRTSLGYGSGHTEAIVTGRPAPRPVGSWRRSIASAVIVNASTRFNDGGQLGLGAEIGISTDKYHARGPCGLA